MDRTRAEAQIRAVMTTWRTAVGHIEETHGAGDSPALIWRIDRLALRMLDDLERRPGFDAPELRWQLRVARGEVEAAMAKRSA